VCAGECSADVGLEEAARGVQVTAAADSAAVEGEAVVRDVDWDAVEKATAAMVAEERVQVTRVTVDMDLATVVVGVKEGELEAVDLEAVDSEVAEKVVAGLEEVARETVTVEAVAPDPCS